MALIMTHIRFALDLADRFSIQEPAHYISGTVYPDSRWVSGIDRELTHHERFRLPDFPTDDFKRGWQVHCICDDIQNSVFEERFPEIAALPRQERWVQMSVAKLIQDMADLQQFNPEEQLIHLDHVTNPNGEDLGSVKRFYGIIRNTYEKGGVPSSREYKQLWLDVGLSDELAEQIIQGLESRLAHRESMRLIETTYAEMVRAVDLISL